MKRIAKWIREAMQIASKWVDMSFEGMEEEAKQSKDIKKIAQEVKELCKKFPLK